MCDVDGYPEFSRANRRRARKQHKCAACYEPIPPGDRYVRHVGKFDGYMYDDCHCLRCWEMFEGLRDLLDEPVVTTLDCDNDPLPEGSPLDWLAFATREEMQKETA